jgi:hypothetical protein
LPCSGLKVDKQCFLIHPPRAHFRYQKHPT